MVFDIFIYLFSYVSSANSENSYKNLSEQSSRSQKEKTCKEREMRRCHVCENSVSYSCTVVQKPESSRAAVLSFSSSLYSYLKKTWRVNRRHGSGSTEETKTRGFFSTDWTQNWQTGRHWGHWVYWLWGFPVKILSDYHSTYLSEKHNPFKERNLCFSLQNFYIFKPIYPKNHCFFFHSKKLQPLGASFERFNQLKINFETLIGTYCHPDL